MVTSHEVDYIDDTIFGRYVIIARDGNVVTASGAGAVVAGWDGIDGVSIADAKYFLDIGGNYRGTNEIRA